MKNSKLRLLTIVLIVIFSFGIIVNGESVNFIDEGLDLMDTETTEDLDFVEEAADEDYMQVEVAGVNVTKKLEKGKNYRIENRSSRDLSKYVKLSVASADYRYIDKHGELHYDDNRTLTKLNLDGETEYIISVNANKTLTLPEELLNVEIFIEETNEPALYFQYLENEKSYQIGNTSKEDLSAYIEMNVASTDYRYIDKYGDLYYDNNRTLTKLNLDGETEYVISPNADKFLYMPYNKYKQHYGKDIFIEESLVPALYKEDFGKNKNYRIINTSKEDLSAYIKMNVAPADYRYIDKYGDLSYDTDRTLAKLNLDGETEYVISPDANKFLYMPYNKYEDHYGKDIFIEESLVPALYHKDLEKNKNYRIINTSKEDLSAYIKMNVAPADYRYIDKYGDLRYDTDRTLAKLNLDGETEYVISLNTNKPLYMPYNKYEDHYGKEIFIEESLVPALFKKDLTWNKAMTIENISKGNNLAVRFNKRGEFQVRHLDYSGKLIEEYKKAFKDIVVPSNSILELTHTSKQNNYVYTAFNNTEEFLIIDKEKELTSEYKDFPGKDINDEKKSWTIEFSQTIDGFTANKRNVYIIDSKGQKFENMNVKSVGNKIILENTGRFTKGEKYEVVIEKEVRSIKGKSLTNGVSMIFELN